jgi:hypothetical protein
MSAYVVEFCATFLGYLLLTSDLAGTKTIDKNASTQLESWKR